MSAFSAFLLVVANLALLWLLLGVRLGTRTFRQTVAVRASADRLWSALWPLGENAGWSDTIRKATDLGEGRIRTELSWEARDGGPVVQILQVSGLAPGERFAVTVADDNTLDDGFWAHYRRKVSIERDVHLTRVSVEITDRYRGVAFMLFRYFVVRRELIKLRTWAKTGRYASGGIVEHPATQFISAGVSTLLFWALLGFSASGFMIAFLLTLVIVLHEFGHMAAFRLMGHRNVRMIFIPLLGGLAIGGRPYNSHYEIAFSALMGSGFSAFLVPVAFGAFAAATETGDAHSAQNALIFCGLCCLFNLANLLPIWKFDGGQVLRQICASQRQLTVAASVLLAGFLLLGHALDMPPAALLSIGFVVVFLSLFTRGKQARPRNALVPIARHERALIAIAFTAIAVTHASGLFWAARMLF